MRKYFFSTLTLLMFSAATALSQHRTAMARKNPAVAVSAEPTENPRIVEMREATQQIVFIDSVVIKKDQLLAEIKLNQESGNLYTYHQFFRSQSHSDSYVYLNEMGNKCYFADQGENGFLTIYTSDKLGREWSTPTPVKGLGDGLSDMNYPFMMADGTTFYFASRGQESIGGYDIFVTRYDFESGSFLKPENLGMPFNSEANDYMYVIDEISNIGYFATDRRQPEGMVCVYVFIPPVSRQSYDRDDCTDEQLKNFANINCIADTWGSGDEYKAALKRLEDIGKHNAHVQDKGSFSFVVNDRQTYNSIQQFRSSENANLFKSLLEAKQKLVDMKSQLDKSRNYYAKSSPEDKRLLKTEILDAEKEYESLYNEIKDLEKQIRNTENRLISQ